MTITPKKPHVADDSLSRVFLPPWLKMTVLVCAALVFALGVTAMFFTSKETGSAALLGAGIALLVLVIFGDRVSSIEALGVKLEVGRQLNKVADQAEREGHLDTAQQLRSSAHQLLETSGHIAASYDLIRTNQRSGYERTNMMQSFVQQARVLASLAGTPDEVAALFDTEEPGQRISALAIMQERPELSCPRIIEEAIKSPRSGFEQYQALRAAEAFLQKGASEKDRERLIAVLQKALPTGRLGRETSDRNHLARRLISANTPST